MSVTSRESLIEYCLRRLGAPVLEINVDPDQVEDRIDEALQYFQEYHSDATFKTFVKHQVTSTDVDNEYIEISENIQFISRLFPVRTGFTGRGMFDIKYQMHMQDMRQFTGQIAHYHQMQQYLSLLEQEFTGMPQTEFTRHQNRLYIFGDFGDQSIREGDWIVVEAYQIVDPEIHGSVYNDMWIKEYSTALIKEQWGANLLKFEGMQLPGGVTMNGRQIFEDAMTEQERLREKIRMEHEYPIDFFVG